jgi:hypothetical protein
MDPKRTRSASGESSRALDGILDAAQEIALRRREILTRMKKAVKANDTREIVRAARLLCGADDERKKSN